MTITGDEVIAMPYKTYYNMGRLDQLRYRGRELIGKELFITVKRDGQNIPVYWNDGFVEIGSYHRSVADPDMQSKVKKCPEWPKIVEMMSELPNHVIYFEHIMGGGDSYHKSPTRIERPKKHSHLILIDIYDLEFGRYYSYNFSHQQAHKYRIPIVKLLDQVEPQDINEVYAIKDQWLKWCKKHSREGVCIKDYYSNDQIFVKEKIDLPRRKKIPKKKNTKPKYPPMPEEKIETAVERALNECKENGEDVHDPKFAMPRVARHIATEAREHFYETPGNMFMWYRKYLELEP